MDRYRECIESALIGALEEMGPPSSLRDACSYALLGKAKRVRPLIVLMIGNALGRPSILPAALSVEFFHTASLIADDLPCMDNDVQRRGRPSLHIAFGESTALLASYTLIAAGYGAIYEMGRQLKKEDPRADEITVKCLEEVTHAAGLRGATYGQFLDLFSCEATFDTLRSIIELKTVSLFEVAFVLGWLFGGGDPLRLVEVKRCAACFGFSFQIADDARDVCEDGAKRKNLVRVLGGGRAKELFEQGLEQFIHSLKELSLWSDEFQLICSELAEAGSCFGVGVFRS